MIDFAIVAALVIVFITACIVYYTRPDNKLRVETNNCKPRSKEELLSARVKHFQKVKVESNKSDDNTNENDVEVEGPGTKEKLQNTDRSTNTLQVETNNCKPRSKEELLSTRVKHFQKVKVASNKSDDTTNENDLEVEGLGTKEKLLNTEVEHFQGIKPTDVKTGDIGDLKDSLREEVTGTGLPNQVPEEVSDMIKQDPSEKSMKQEKQAEVFLLSSSAFLGNAAQPEIKPLKTLQELLNWMPGYDTFSIAGVLKRPVTSADRSKPKTMICHDMKGGYIEDRFIQGFNSHECFRFNQWSMIDSFCYFSHSFVTIPPPCWTNAAHNNGVKMLGTLITEWDDGAAICVEIFHNTAYVDKIVKLLVEITSYYQFDGWLINIENPIDPTKIDNVRYFLATLTEQMHTQIPDSEVIWYDSVTRNGQLKWQNKLCEENKMFFDACDGIFLNYNWSVNDLKLSFEGSGPHRQHDVYVGVDVFGRGCFGGGGWNTCKAMNVIREEKLSAAIFAPGWVMETLPDDEFPVNDKKFWNLLRTYLYGHCVSTLPLVTTFCEGYGRKIFMCGQITSLHSWTNGSATSVLPSFSNNFYQLGPHDGMEFLSSGFSTDVGFNGGGSYVINGTVSPRAEQTKTVFRLFETRILLKPSKEYFVSYTFQCSSEQLEVFVLLLFDDRPNYLLFKPSVNIKGAKPATYTIPATQDGNYVEISPMDDECVSCHSEFVTSHGWMTRNYKFTLDKQRGLLKEIRLACVTSGNADNSDASGVDETSNFTIRVGELRIHSFSELSAKIPTATNLKCHDVNIRSDGERKWLSFMLSWETSVVRGYVLPKCFDIFCRSECDQVVSCNSADGCIQTKNKEEYGMYIGRTYTNCFYVSDIVVSSECNGGISLIVQGISYAEVRQSRVNCGTITFKW